MTRTHLLIDEVCNTFKAHRLALLSCYQHTGRILLILFTIYPLCPNGYNCLIHHLCLPISLYVIAVDFVL